METVGQLIQQQSNALSRPQAQSQLSSLTTTIEGLRQSILQKYGMPGVEILDKYHPDFLFRKQVTVDDCYFGDYPTIAQLGAEFDRKFPAAWMMAHLHDLSEFCGCKEKLSGHALQQCASTITMEFYWLKISELMLFFHRFKSGKYGRFYGSVDPLVITTSLRDFLKERSIAIAEHERLEAERKERERKPPVTWEEYCMKEYGEIRPYPLERRYTSPSQEQPKKQPKESVEDIIKIAKSLLTETNKTVVEEFGRIFKKKYGSTPAEYIKNHQKDAAKVTKS